MSDFKSAIYGWSIVYKPENKEHWLVDDNEDQNGLPAIFECWEMVLDRFRFLQEKGVTVRVVAVLVQPSDFDQEGVNIYDRTLHRPAKGWWPHKPKRKKGGEP